MLTRTARMMESSSDHTGQPGRKRTRARLPGRLLKLNETPLGASDQHSDAPGPHGTG